jgi:hypothetical protein
VETKYTRVLSLFSMVYNFGYYKKQDPPLDI